MSNGQTVPWSFAIWCIRSLIVWDYASATYKHCMFLSDTLPKWTGSVWALVKWSLPLGDYLSSFMMNSPRITVWTQTHSLICKWLWTHNKIPSANIPSIFLMCVNLGTIVKRYDGFLCFSSKPATSRNWWRVESKCIITSSNKWTWKY